MKKFLTFSMLLLCSQTLLASYYYVKGSNQPIDENKRTHVFITDKANDLGNAPRYAAGAKALKIQKLYPNEQIIFLIPQRSTDDMRTFKKIGFPNFEFRKESLTAVEVFNVLSRFNQIASLHTYGHSAITEGVFLDATGPTDIRWRTESNEPKRLVGHFTDDAFVTLNGCNGGHIMAPTLSKIWNIAVSGAMTSTHFEAIFPDGRYYVANSKQYSIWENTIITSLRLRPENYNYNGHYGRYLQGLPFYKYFCAGVAKDKCLKGMAKSMLVTLVESQLSEKPTYDEFAKATQEWLCPVSDYGSTLQKDCMKKLSELDVVHPQSEDLNYSPFNGVTAKCDFNTCYINTTCLANSQNTATCAKTEKPPQRNTSDTFVKEYLNYLEAFNYL